MQEISLEYNAEAGTLTILDVGDMPIDILHEDMEQVDFNSMNTDQRVQYVFDKYPSINDDIVDAIDSYKW